MRYYDLIYDYENSDNAIFLEIDEESVPFDRYAVNRESKLPIDKIYCTIKEKIQTAMII